MDVQIENGCLRQTIFERRPIQTGVRRVPNPDVRPDINIAGGVSIDRYGVMLYIEQCVPGASATRFPPRAIISPYSRFVSHAAESNEECPKRGIRPIDCNIADQPIEL